MEIEHVSKDFDSIKEYQTERERVEDLSKFEELKRNFKLNDLSIFWELN